MADIKVKDVDGCSITYNNIEQVSFQLADGTGLTTYISSGVVDNKITDPNTKLTGQILEYNGTVEEGIKVEKFFSMCEANVDMFIKHADKYKTVCPMFEGIYAINKSS